MTTTTAIVVRSVPRQDGGYSIMVRLEQRGDRMVMFTAKSPYADGERVRLQGAGVTWEPAR